MAHFSQKFSDPCLGPKYFWNETEEFILSVELNECDKYCYVIICMDV